MRALTRGGQPFRPTDAATIDLGREPPLVVGDKRQDAPVRRAVSWRWLTGIVMTGLTSTALMGGALTAALDGRHELAIAPEARARSTTGDLALANGTKGDRIRLTEPAAGPATRQVIQVSTVSRQGDRDHVKLAPFAKIQASLALRTTELSADVPAYDPIKIFAESAEDPEPTVAEDTGETDLAVLDDEEGSSGDGIDFGSEGSAGAMVENVDGEVAVKVSDFPFESADLEPAARYDVAEVEEIVRGASGTPASGTELAALPYVDAERFNFDEGGDPFSALGVRIIPENVSFVTKSAADAAVDERIISLSPREGLDAVLAEQNVSAADTDRILSAMSELVDLSRLKGDEKVRIAFSPSAGEGEPARPMRVSVYTGGVHQATVARRDDGSFVRTDEPEATALFAGIEPDPAPAPVSGQVPTLYESVYETALEQNVPKDLIRELVKIFSYDVDFQQRVRAGDALEVFHALPDGDETAEKPEDELLYASLTVGGVPKRFYRFRTPDDGYTDYYDEEGKSAKKFLMRKPMNGGILRSTFGYRRHPILGYKRLHAGVDWAAPRGTPIVAAGNGTVVKAGWSSGYGRFTLIRHANGYETAYGHQSAIAKGVVPGAKVRQGQVIGYVGSTGLSTGPHLHYEVRVNSKPVDPLRIRLPRGRVLQGDLLASFERERNRIDALIGNGQPQKVASVE